MQPHVFSVSCQCRHYGISIQQEENMLDLPLLCNFRSCILKWTSLIRPYILYAVGF